MIRDVRIDLGGVGEEGKYDKNIVCNFQRINKNNLKREKV